MRLLLISLVFCIFSVAGYAMSEEGVKSNIEKHFYGFNVEVLKKVDDGKYIIRLFNNNQSNILMTDGQYIYPSAFDIKTKQNIVEQVRLENTYIEVDPLKEGFIQVKQADNNRKLIVITDFECPYCKMHYENFSKTFDINFPEGVNVYFVNFPLSFHEKAELMSKLFIVGDKKGTNLAPTLFGFSKAQLSRDDDYIIKRIALELDMSVQELRNELSKEYVTERLKKDISFAKRADVRGTPTFLVNDADGSNRFYKVKNGDPQLNTYIKEGL